MSKALLLRRDIPRAWIPGIGHGDQECLAANCTVPAKAVVIWLSLPRIEARVVCAGHLQLLRQEAEQRGGGALFFPLDGAPPLEVIKAAVERELARRQPRPQFIYQQPNVFGNTATFTFTATATSW